MSQPRLVLASASKARARLLADAGLAVEAMPARIDEDAVRQALTAEQARPCDVADMLAEMKARKLAERHPDAWVIGCDQVLDFGGTILSKPETQPDALQQLRALSGNQHSLLSAAVIFHQSQPVWRFTGVARLTMRVLSEPYLADYLARNWPAIKGAVGSYQLEAEGVRLFSAIDGDYFTVLGLPLLQILNYLTLRGVIAS